MTNENLRSFVVNIDGEKVVNPVFHRYHSPVCFDLFGLIPEQQHAPRVYPADADGYWVMLKPLATGRHKITFFAEYGSHKLRTSNMVQDIDYVFDVVEQ